MRALQILAALLLVLFLVGCSGAPSEKSEETNEQASSEQVAADNEQTQPAEQAATKELKDILSDDLEYKATYEVFSDGETNTITMAYDMPKFAHSTMAEEGESKTIFDGESIIVCTKDEEWQCIKMTSQEEAETPNSMQTEESIASGEYDPIYVGSCSVAGEKGLKYEVSAEGYTTSVCYTNDGILLEMKTEGYSMTATSISRNVPSSEFVPPAEPVDFEAMLQNLPSMEN